MTDAIKRTTDKDYLKIALEQARNSVLHDGFPAGAVLIKDNKIISKGVSLGFKIHDPTSHAETASIREACNVLQTTDLTSSTLYASLEPCLMCFSVANWGGISKIIFGCRKTSEMVLKGYYEGKTDISQINKNNNRQIEIIFMPDFEKESLDIVKNWEEKTNLI